MSRNIFSIFYVSLLCMALIACQNKDLATKDDLRTLQDQMNKNTTLMQQSEERNSSIVNLNETGITNEEKLFEEVVDDFAIKSVEITGPHSVYGHFKILANVTSEKSGDHKIAFVEELFTNAKLISEILTTQSSKISCVQLRKNYKRPSDLPNLASLGEVDTRNEIYCTGIRKIEFSN